MRNVERHDRVQMFHGISTFPHFILYKKTGGGFPAARLYQPPNRESIFFNSLQIFLLILYHKN